jgi:hypothetical protein
MICDYQLTVRGLRIHAQSAGEGVPLLLHSGVFSEMHTGGRSLSTCTAAG